MFDEKAEKELFRELSKDYISGLTLTGGDPLHENNIDGVLNLVNKIRLQMPNKTIWLYTGYTVNFYEVYNSDHTEIEINPKGQSDSKRASIISMCDVVVDGRYIDSQKDISLRWRGSKNQRVIDVKNSLQQGEVVLYCE